MLAAAHDAGDAVMEVYASDFTAEHKGDGSPVTLADARAEAVILAALAATGIPVVAEESAAAGQVPEINDRFFLVDPLDGTKEFLKRNGEFTVNIALIENGRPRLGVVLAPATGAVFAGGPDGAFVGSGRCEFGAMRRTGVSEERPLKLVASRSHGHAALAKLQETMDLGPDVSVGSSLKFCLLATGEAHLYPRFTPTCEWDTAAGQAVLEAAGGAVVTLEGEPLRYGKAGLNFLNPFFVAAASEGLAKEAARSMREALAA